MKAGNSILSRQYPQSKRPRVGIVCPATGAQNNGNWRTAERWAKLLMRYAEVTIHLELDEKIGQDLDLLIALHARRSASAIQLWNETFPNKPLVVVLTGTDLYRDIAQDTDAQQSLERADRLVVLQELGIEPIPKPYHSKTRCIFQSTSLWKPAQKTTRQLRVVMVGHLRSEKSPETFFEAARIMASQKDIQFSLIGAGLDPHLLEEAQSMHDSTHHFHYLGALPHTQTRTYIRHAHLLIHPSKMEGGAHVIMEAICSGTPVLASDIPGNQGMLGPDYDGYFEWGQVDQLCGLISRCRDTQSLLSSSDRFLDHLTAQCSARAILFTHENEQHSLMDLLNELLPT